MKGRIVLGIITVILVAKFAFLIIDKKEDQKHQNFSVLQIGSDVVSVYRNGNDFTETYKNLEYRAKEKAAKYLNKDISELQFCNYSILEMAGMTIEVTVEDMYYTFLFDIDGKILQVNYCEKHKINW